MLATAYRDVGEIGTSISTAESGLKLDPNDREIKVVLCSDYSLAGQPQRARALARDIISAEPMFSVRSYAGSQPYQDIATLDRLCEGLRQAGLPE
jgi:hypothetical protein